jgi:RNA polymerase sigma factor (sigma-70 family)
LLGASIVARADTSDVAQEGILQAWQDLGDFRGDSPEQLEAWMRRIGAGHASKIRRHHLARKRSVEDEEVVESPIVEQTISPAAIAELKETNAILAGAIEELNDRMQTVILMSFFEREPLTRIAERLGCSVSSARDVFGAAIQQLHVILVERGLGESDER